MDGLRPELQRMYGLRPELQRMYGLRLRESSMKNKINYNKGGAPKRSALGAPQPGKTGYKTGLPIKIDLIASPSNCAVHMLKYLRIIGGLVYTIEC